MAVVLLTLVKDVLFTHINIYLNCLSSLNTVGSIVSYSFDPSLLESLTPLRTSHKMRQVLVGYFGAVNNCREDI